MKYSKNPIKALLALVSKINFFLSEEKNIIISDLLELENFFNYPKNNEIKGSLTLSFSFQHKLQDGTIVKLTETIDFNSNDFFIKSIWHEDYLGICSENICYRIAQNEPEELVFYSISYSINAVLNILSENKGAFEIITNQFQVVKLK